MRRNIDSEQNTLRTTEEELFAETKRSEDMNAQIIEVQEELTEIEHRGVKLADDLKELN